ncbi:MAG: hypothetical protein WC197_03085 [Candidatus Gastranaerophilaceae bacterium]|jgi:hypothetical protein
MKNFNYIIFFLISTLFLLQTAPCEAFEVQKIKIEPNQTYMIIFDKTIKNYTLNSNSSIKVEILNNLFSDKTQLLFTPLNKDNSSITVITEDNTYCLEICVNDKKETTFEAPVLKGILENAQVDLPPTKQIDDLPGFDLDTPPEVR